MTESHKAILQRFRESTALPILGCIRVLDATDWDFDKAIEQVRHKLLKLNDQWATEFNPAGLKVPPPRSDSTPR